VRLDQPKASDGRAIVAYKLASDLVQFGSNALRCQRVAHTDVFAERILCMAGQVASLKGQFGLADEQFFDRFGRGQLACIRLAQQERNGRTRS
jgi:hypothetical protein